MTRVLIVLLVAVGSTQAGAITSVEIEEISRINDERERAGLLPLEASTSLSRIAREHSARMERDQTLSHNERLGEQCPGARKLGENVGVGPTVAEVHDRFMESPGHRRNILDDEFRRVGVGVVYDDDGWPWVTVVFYD